MGNYTVSGPLTVGCGATNVTAVVTSALGDFVASPLGITGHAFTTNTLTTATQMHSNPTYSYVNASTLHVNIASGTPSNTTDPLVSSGAFMEFFYSGGSIATDSFDIIGCPTTTVKTQGGGARITHPAAKTQTAKAKLQSPFSITSGKAAILKVVDADQPAKAQVEAVNPTFKTQQALADILNSSPRTLLGLGKVIASTLNTTPLGSQTTDLQQRVPSRGPQELPKSGTTNYQNQPNLGGPSSGTNRMLLSYSSNLALATYFGRVTDATKEPVNPGTSYRVGVGSTMVPTGYHRLIQVGATTTQDTSAATRITHEQARNIDGVAKIAGTTTPKQNTDGVARVEQAVPQDQDGLALITGYGVQPQTGVTRITNKTQADQSGIASIQNDVDRDQDGVARIEQVVNETQDGVANIILGADQDQDGAGRIEQVVSKDQHGAANIINDTDRDQTGVAQIDAPSTTQDQPGGARIAKDVDVTHLAKAHITGVGPSLTSPQDQPGTTRIAFNDDPCYCGPKQPTVVFVSGTLVLEVKNPELGDSRTVLAPIKLMDMMDGSIRTRRDSAIPVRLQLTFIELSRVKALEFRDFLVSTMGEYVRYQDYRGEWWRGKMTLTPEELVVESKGGGSSLRKESSTIKVTFEGYKT